MSNRREAKWRIHNRRRKTGAIIISILAVLLIVGAVILKSDKIFNLFFSPNVDGGKDLAVSSSDENSDLQFGSVTGTERKEGVYNILVMGCDREAMLTDVMMLVSFDSKNQKVAVAQIPRDTYVRHSVLEPKTSHKNVKMNSLYQRGYNFPEDGVEPDVSGIENLVRAVDLSFGVTVDRYVFMDLEGFSKIVNLVGGVDINVPMDMKYEDSEQNLYINLKAGMQHLDGDQAEQFVRFRHGYAQGDLGRVNAQKLFLSAFMVSAKKNLKISNATEIAKTLSKYVITSMDLSDIAFFVRYGLGVEAADITTFTMPGVWADSYYWIYRQDSLDLINQYLNVYEKQMTIDDFDPNVILAQKGHENDYLTGTGEVDVYSLDKVENEISIPKASS